MRRTVFKIIILSIVLMVVVPFSAFAVDGQIKIGQTASTTFPIVIDQPGSYVLTSNIAVPDLLNGFEITASNVTLDLNGHTIAGESQNSNLRGINVTGGNISVSNGAISSFEGGIHGSGLRLHNLRISNTWTAIEVTNSVITQCIFQETLASGVYITKSTIENSTVSAGWNGISAVDSNVINCIVFDVTEYGLTARNSTVTNCTVTGVGPFAVAGIEARNSTVTNCTVKDCTTDGIYSENSTITKCNLSGNIGGIVSNGGSRIEGNNVRDNSHYGLRLEGSYNYVIKNTASGNASGNFQDNGTSNHMLTTGDNANMGW